MEERIAKLIARKRELNQLQLTEQEGKQLLKSCGLGVPEGNAVTNLDEAKKVAAQLGYPVVVKGLIGHITHKSEHGLVKVGIPNEKELEKTFTHIDAKCRELASKWQILIEQQKKGRLELVVGLTTDDVFGKVLMFGLGGIFVEVMKDVTFKICPISRQDAYDMISSLRSRSIFSGVRGQKPVDIDKVADFLMQIGGSEGIAAKFGDRIETIEINPAIIGIDDSITALDAVVTIASSSEKPAQGQIKEYVDMERLFNPKSIGIVGISPDKPSLARAFLQITMEAGYKGKVYPININQDGKEVEGWRIYDRLTSVPDEIDYLYVSVPAPAVPQVLLDGAGKVRFAQIITSGFGEASEEGKKIEEAVLEASQKSGTRLVGPNCLGMFSPESGVILVPGILNELGTVGIVSQSGGIASEILRTGGARGIRFSKAISVGNCLDLVIEDFLEFMARDAQTKVIGIYAEHVKDGHRLFRLLKDICKVKPVVIIKGGRSSLGAKAASSHTGALTSNYGLWEAMCRQTGATLVRTFNEFLNTLLAFQALTPSHDNKIFLVSHSGGITVTGSDLCEDFSLAVPELEEQLQNELFTIGIPPGASVKNPVDIPLGTLAARTGAGAKLSIMRDMFEFVGQRKQFSYDVLYLMTDNVMVAPSGVHIVKDLIDLAVDLGGFNGTRAKKFVLAVNGSVKPEVVREECERAARLGVPVFRDLGDALQAVSKVVSYGGFLNSLTKNTLSI